MTVTRATVLNGSATVEAELTPALATLFALGDATDRTPGVRLLSRTDAIAARFVELCAGARFRLRCMDAGLLSGILPTAATRPNTRAQVIRRLQDHGGVPFPRTAEETRSRARVPVTMVHVDDRAALVLTDHSGRTAMAIQAPAIVGMLAEWFDLLWDHPGTVTHRVAGASCGLTDTQREVLILLPAANDESIARRLGLSVTTVRRHVKAIYQELGVNSRFAAGMAAAKLNWI